MIASAFAPASVANVCVGFDHLGYSMDAVGDLVTVKLTAAKSAAVSIRTIDNGGTIPLDPKKNTASVAALSVLIKSNSNYAAELWIEKGISMSSGMGGSAASAVAAAFATNKILQDVLSDDDLTECMVDGEELASGERHYDNIIPCFKGGLRLIETANSIQLPDTGWYSTLIHPDLEIATKQARQILPATVPLKQMANQCALGMSTITALFKGDFSLLRSSMRDLVIEPARSQLIPQFQILKTKATELGAAGFSISGAGPSIMAWSKDQNKANEVGLALQQIWSQSGITSDYWVTPIERPGVQQKNEIPEYAR